MDTPGPWHEEEEHGGIYVNTEEGYHVAQVFRLAANARLIAAAPEMLEALKALVETIPHADHGIWEKARAIIAKAEGNEAASV
jgi:hypothetical protein